MNATAILRKAHAWGPVLFGIGFVAPLIAQSLDAARIPAPWGLTPLQLGLAVGLAAGSVAKLRGSWL